MGKGADGRHSIITERFFIKGIRSSIVAIRWPLWVSRAAKTMFFSASLAAWQFNIFTSIRLIGMSLLYNGFQ